MECGYVCEVIRYLLKNRLGTSLVILDVLLSDMDNRAALDLLCALFKQRERHASAHYTNMSAPRPPQCLSLALRNSRRNSAALSDKCCGGQRTSEVI